MAGSPTIWPWHHGNLNSRDKIINQDNDCSHGNLRSFDIDFSLLQIASSVDGAGDDNVIKKNEHIYRLMQESKT